ncbi:MAG: prephenate dehydratase [Actinomycetota bacterium]|nr:prephenate dehydratase [Actinomycetota bacterium]
MPKVGYLGPKGTFTQEALETYFPSIYEGAIPFATVPETLFAIESGEVEKGLVPIENSIEGSVNATLDTLAFETDLLIEEEAILPVRHCLIVRKGVRMEDIQGIISHPHASAQCRRFLLENLPNVPVFAANSTADAALEVSKADKPLAALATRIAAEIYGLEVLRKDVEDFAHNVTRFVLVGKELSPKTGRDKTSLICFIKENRPGSLLEILTTLASKGVNLTKVESRPTKKALGEYYFLVDAEGHIQDEPLKEAIEELKGKLRKLKFLGSYPAAEAPAVLEEGS